MLKLFITDQTHVIKDQTEKHKQRSYTKTRKEELRQRKTKMMVVRTTTAKMSGRSLAGGGTRVGDGYKKHAKNL